MWQYGLCVLKESPSNPSGIHGISKKLADVKSHYREYPDDNKRYSEIDSTNQFADFDLGFSE